MPHNDVKDEVVEHKNNKPGNSDSESIEKQELLDKKLKHCLSYLPINHKIFEFIYDANPSTWPLSFTFGGTKYAREQALTLVLHAGSLKALEFIVRKHPFLLMETFKKDGKEGTLLQLAIIGLDITIEWKKQDGKVVVIPGMANMLLDLHRKLVDEQKLSEESYGLAIKQAQQAACVDKLNASDAKAQIDARGNIYLEQLNVAFNEIKKQKDPKGVDRALENFKHFVLHGQEKVLGGRPVLMKDCEYNLGLQQLHALAFQLFRDRGEEFYGKWYGEQAKTYCLISGVIQEEMPSLMRSLLRSKKGIYAVLNGEEKFERTLDIDGSKFHTLDIDGTQYQLGVTFFYDCFGGEDVAGALLTSRFFSELFTNTYNSIAKLLQTQPEQPKSQEQLLSR